MKKYIIPIAFTAVVIAVLVFAVRASMSEENNAKPAKSPESVQVSDKQKEELKRGHSKGSSDAKVVITEFADFQCSACKAFNPVVQEIMKENEGKVRLVFKHLPLYPSPHKNAMVSAYSAEASAKQGKFWEMSDKLYATQEEWAEMSDPKPKFEEYARELGLNVDDFKRDLDAKAGKDTIEADKNLAKDLKLTGTPSVFVNGEEFDMQSGGGAEGLKAKIKQLVQEAYGANQ